MKTIIWTLGLALLVQLGLAGFLNLKNRTGQDQEQDTPLLTLERNQVDTISIRDKDGQVQLTRKDNTWILPASADFPASEEQVNGLLDKLTRLHRGWPVATTQEAAGRFKVAPDHFERHIRLLQGKKQLGSLYLGSSPGIRRVYARLDGDTNIYGVSLALYAVPAKPEDWIDKNYLHLKQDTVASIKLKDFTLVAKKEGWTLQPLPTGKSVDANKAATLADKILSLRISAVLGTKEKPAYALQEPALTFTIVRKKGATRNCALGKAAKDQTAVLHCSDTPYYFRVNSWEVKPLLEASLDNLVKQPEPAKKSGTAPDQTSSTQPATGEPATKVPQHQ